MSFRIHSHVRGLQSPLQEHPQVSLLSLMVLISYKITMLVWMISIKWSWSTSASSLSMLKMPWDLRREHRALVVSGVRPRVPQTPPTLGLGSIPLCDGVSWPESSLRSEFSVSVRETLTALREEEREVGGVSSLITLTWDTNFDSCLDWQLSRAFRLKESDLENRLETDLKAFRLGELLCNGVWSCCEEFLWNISEEPVTAALVLESETFPSDSFISSTWKSFFLTKGSCARLNFKFWWCEWVMSIPMVLKPSLGTLEWPAVRLK